MSDRTYSQVKLAQVHEYNAFTVAGTCAMQITGNISSAIMFAGMVTVKNKEQWNSGLKHNDR